MGTTRLKFAALFLWWGVVVPGVVGFTIGYGLAALSGHA